MDSGSIIAGAILLLICLFPFIITYYIRTKKSSHLLKILNEHAKNQNCKLSQHEFCGDFILGVDESRKWIFFLKQKKENIIFQNVNLEEIQACRTEKKLKNGKNVNGQFSIIDRVELHFIPSNKSKRETIFELYEEETNTQLSGELQFVDKWSKRINDLKKSNNN